MKSLTYVEIDIPRCSRTYGVAPCTAVVGVTGNYKCFNSPKSCQDRPNYNEVGAMIRFAVDTAYLPDDIECIPSIVSVSFDGATVSLGENLGVRATLSVTFRDHRHSDTGAAFDKYQSTRGYDPYKLGTFWGKFRARHPYLRGQSLRLIRGLLGESLTEMETRHYIIDSFTGPDTNGAYTIVAKDILKLADDDRAKAPAVSNGYLNANITNVATTATLTPAGIGNAEYPSSGHVAIAGKEICAFTRVGDVLTLTRAQMNTTAIAHNQDDRVQIVLIYTGEDPANIIWNLLVNYAGVSSDYLPLDSWLLETATYLQRVYTARIAEPTGVNQLISELVEQAALAMWWDDKAQLLKLQVLRDVPADASSFTEENTIAESLAISEQPEKRVSEVWTYFGQRNPLEPIDRVDNYRSIQAVVDGQAESDYGSAAIKKIMSRWIPDFGRTTATRVCEIQLARYKDPPRAFSFEIFRQSENVENDVSLGGGYKIGSWALQDEQGAPALVPVQVTRLQPEADRYIVEAEEISFAGISLDDPNDRTIVIDTDTLNFNLRSVHDSLFPEITSPVGLTLTCIIAEGVKVGSNSISLPAFDVGSWVASLSITIVNNGRIQGKGGAGGTGGSLPEAGGVALYTRYPVTVDNNSEIFGGGGGASFRGAVVGGGGAGYVSGGTGATTEVGGHPQFPVGHFGGQGGGPGLAGETVVQTGGAAGAAVDGVSYCTFVTTGDRRGGLIN